MFIMLAVIVMIWLVIAGALLTIKGLFNPGDWLEGIVSALSWPILFMLGTIKLAWNFLVEKAKSFLVVKD